MFKMLMMTVMSSIFADKNNQARLRMVVSAGTWSGIVRPGGLTVENHGAQRYRGRGRVHRAASTSRTFVLARSSSALPVHPKDAVHFCVGGRRGSSTGPRRPRRDCSVIGSKLRRWSREARPEVAARRRRKIQKTPVCAGRNATRELPPRLRPVRRRHVVIHQRIPRERRSTTRGNGRQEPYGSKNRTARRN